MAKQSKSPKRPKTPPPLERFILLRTSQPDEYGSLDQDLAIVQMSVEHARLLTARCEAARAIRAADTKFLSMKYFDGSVGFFVASRLVEQIREHFPRDREAKRLVGIIEKFEEDCEDGLLVESPSSVVSSMCREYDDDEDARLNCFVVRVDGDGFMWTAYSKHSSEEVETESVTLDEVRKLGFMLPMGDPAPEPEKVAAPTQ